MLRLSRTKRCVDVVSENMYRDYVKEPTVKEKKHITYLAPLKLIAHVRRLEGEEEKYREVEAIRADGDGDASDASEADAEGCVEKKDQIDHFGPVTDRLLRFAEAYSSADPSSYADASPASPSSLQPQQQPQSQSQPKPQAAATAAAR